MDGDVQLGWEEGEAGVVGGWELQMLLGGRGEGGRESGFREEGRGVSGYIDLDMATVDGIL